MIRVGCQTYTWEMLGTKWQGSVDDILEAVSKAGFQGIEISANMIGKYYDRPEEFAKALKKHGLELAAFAFASNYGFSDPEYKARWVNRSILKWVGAYVYKTLGLGRMTGYSIDTITDCAGRFVQALGFKQEGRIRNGVFCRGEFRDLFLYGCLREEWRWL